MKVGVCFPSDVTGSVRWVFQSILEGLSPAHDVIFPPHAYKYVREARERLMLESFVRECDAIVGLTNVDVLKARQRIGSTVPFISCQLGNLPRGAFPIRPALPYLTTNDRLLVNCSSDAHIARKFLESVDVRVLPLSYDEQVFFPVGAVERSRLRAKHGFAPQDRVLIYAGRGTLSKNLLTLIRVFDALVHMVSDVHLIIAGPLAPGRGGLLRELGVWPVHFAQTVDRFIAKLSLPRERLHVTGDVAGERLRELYSVADVKVNLTLHHDENFGLSQIEAMACGTPVIGSAWGGLKDTIVDGTSGYKVGVAIGSTGVKANWWEAVSKTASLLTNPAEHQRLRESSIRHAREHYSSAAFQRNLLEIVSSGIRDAEPCPAPLKPTPFATEFWSACTPRPDGVMYRPGDRSFELYTELMAAYCGAAPEDLDPSEPLEDDQVLCLAWPIHPGKNGGIRPDDPHYPFEVCIPPEYLETFHSAMDVMRRKPVITVGELRRAMPAAPALNETLCWMLSAVLLRSRRGTGVAPCEVSAQPREPLLAVEEVDPAELDFIVYAATANRDDLQFQPGAGS